VRRGRSSLKAYPPISFKISIKGDSAMDYRIKKKGVFRIVGVSAPLEKEIEKNFEVVPAMWGQAAENGTIDKLVTMMDGDLKGLLGVSSCNEESDWKYYIAVASNQAVEIELERRIVTEWLPTSGYEFGNAPDIEVYISPNLENAVYEVWIPVVKKN
jgi:AraC family transcriptional regulator